MPTIEGNKFQNNNSDGQAMAPMRCNDTTDTTVYGVATIVSLEHILITQHLPLSYPYII